MNNSESTNTSTNNINEKRSSDESETTNERLASMLKGLLDATPDLVFAKGLDYRYITHNDAFSQLVGRPDESLSGLSDQDIFTDADAIQRLRRNDEIIFASLETIRSQESASYPDGRQVLLDTLKTPFYDDQGQLVGLLGVSRDVTDRVAAEKAAIVEKEKAQRASQAKSEFLAKMSHEIRTPMNAVIGLSKLLRKMPLGVDQGDYVDKIISSADVLLNIINDILDYSKIEAQRLTLEHIPFNLQSVIDRAVTICELKAQEKNLELVLRLPSEVPHDLQGDPHRLQQILVNLISNAIKFTECGHVLIRVSVVTLKNDQLTLGIAVSDSGIGISPEQQKRLFRSFSQVDNSYTRKFEGAGLGLAISRQLVELMGGELSVESQLGKGSTFFFTMDCQVHHTKAPSCPLLDFGDLRALVVDDNSIARGIVREMLVEWGVAVECATNGREAVSKVRQACAIGSEFDFILMDWRMPELDGISAASQIKQELGQAHVPAVLLLSAYDLEEGRRAVKGQQIDIFLQKPVNARTLKDAICRTQTVANLVVTGDDVTTASDCAAVYSDSRVLLVDDNAVNRTVVLGLMQGTGVTIDVAVDGLDAIEKVGQRDYDLVLMDIQMPKMDGLTATGIIRNNETYASLPIVAMTANAMAGDKQKSLAAGMNDYLTKPIDSGKLSLVLGQWLTETPKRPPDQITRPRAHKPASSGFLDRLAGDGVLAVEQALTRCQRRVGFLQELIVDFFYEYRHIGVDLKTLHANADYQALYIKVHSLKANAEFVGAHELAGLCARLEPSARCGSVSKVDVDSICRLAGSVIAKLEIAIQLEPSVTQFNKQRISDELPGLLRRLHPLLIASDFSAEHCLAELAILCEATPHKRAAAHIAELVADIQFELAAEQCALLISDLEY